MAISSHWKHNGGASAFTRKTVLLCAFMLSSCLHIAAQQLSGYVVDERNSPVGGASVILQTKDSIFIKSGLTDKNGYFVLHHQPVPYPYRLLIHHVSYFYKMLNVENEKAPLQIVLEERNIKLKGIDVLAKPPLIHLASNGAFVYNVSRLLETSSATNALDLLDDIPCIIKTDDQYNVIGSGNTTILINGQKNNMTVNDLKGLLAQTNINDVKNVEIYYNTPLSVRGGGNGASINIILQKKRSQQTQVSGDAYTTAYVGRRFYEVGGFHIGLTQQRWSLDLGYALGGLNKAHYATTYSNHVVDDELHTIEMPSNVYQDLFSHRVNGRFSFDFKNKSSLTLTYDVKFTDRHITTSIPSTDIGRSHTDNQGNINGFDAMHVATAEYVSNALTIGGDMVLYNYHTAQELYTNDNGITNNLMADNCQKVNHESLYVNHHHTLANGILHYGASTSLSCSNNKFWNKWTEENTQDNGNSTSRQKETSAEAFVSWSRTWSKNTTLTAGLKAQYYYASLSSPSEKRTMWNNLYYSPSINLQHSISKRGTLLFTFSTYRTYPSYYSTSENKRYHNAYRVDVSNPALKPYVTYEAHLNHIWGGKYIIGVYAVMKPDIFLHYAYQNPNRLQIENGYYNCHTYNTTGFIMALPYDWSETMQTKLTADMYYHERQGSYADGDIRFHTHDFSGTVNLSNSLSLLRHKSLLLQLSVSYSLPHIEATRDYPHQWNSTAAVVWNPNNSPWHFTLKANDLFNTSPIWVCSAWQNQHLVEHLSNDTRALSLNVRYVFNAFKQKSVHQVDTSRMQALAE